MLKRKFKIQKYISVLKNKRKYKQAAIKNHQILKNRLNEVKTQQKVEEEQKQIPQSSEESSACWVDEHDQQPIQLQSQNMFRKFGSLPSTSKQYEKKVKKFYDKKYDKFNWAQSMEMLQQKDVNDYMDEEIYYDNVAKNISKVGFFARTSTKHDSIVSGVDWKGNVMFSTGYDHKVKVWSTHIDENPQMKIQLQKDIYVDGLALTSCTYRQGQLIMGTLKKNYVMVDTEKWKPHFLTSNFLSDMHNYENLRVSATDLRLGIFSKMKVSIMDKNSIYTGSILANQPLTDVQFNPYNPHILYGTSLDTIYEWDLRKYQISQLSKKYLSFTNLAILPDSLAVGSRLGTIYTYDMKEFAQIGENSNLVTHITYLSTNKQGNKLIGLSKWKSNGARVIDSVTGKAIGDWPGAKTKMGFPTKASFAQDDKFGVGSSQGYINVYEWAKQ